MTTYIKIHLAESLAVKQALLSDDQLVSLIEHAGNIWGDCLQAGGKIMFAGNGGSASDAQHLAGELISRFYYDRPALAGLALTTDTSVLTAIGNDYGYDQTFVRQIRGLGRPGDILVGLSTSGNSANVLVAMTAARELGMKTIGLTGRSGGKLAGLVDCCLRMPSDSTPRIQECHITVGHILCAMVEQRCFPSKTT
jgi:D-sedoheptulose 7-phosphate isomerase